MMFAMKASAVQGDWVGRVIDGRYSLRQWLGGAGSNGVFLTEIPGTQQKAAIKFMPAEEGAEARIAFAADAARTHPRLIRIFESGHCEMDGSTFVYAVTEYADEVLSEILPVRPLTADETRELMIPVLDALSDLHGNGLVHGHIRPSNILVVNDVLKLSSDGIQPEGEAVSATAALKTYDAPERAAGRLSASSDVWSLGVTVVEALTQRTPDWNRAANQDPKVPDDLPQPFAEIATACLRVDPADRASLNDIRKRLGVAAKASTHQSVQDSRTGESTEPTSSKPRSRATAVVVALLAFAAVAALIWWRTYQPAPATLSTDEPPAQSSAPAPVPTPTPPPATQTDQVAAEQPLPEQAKPEPEQRPTAAPVVAAPAPHVPSATGAKGAVAERVMPDILPEASRSIQGKVNVHIHLNVSPSGEVTDAGFESAGPSKYFARIAMQAARQWKFVPPAADGQPVASEWSLRFVFTQGNTDVTPTQTNP
jgi:TonB family protein